MPNSEQQVAEIRERLFEPLEGSKSVSWHEFEDVLQRTLSEGMGPVRSAWGMEKAWQNLDHLDKWRTEVQAKDHHDLLRVHEVYNMLTVARCMITAAMFRKESRFGQCQNRLDFPDTDDRQWLGQVTINRDGEGKAQPTFVPIAY